ncbi:MAG: hypothetical protein ABSG50_02990 [Opitutaceae bacterium]|jgi:uncharacterized membrane protein YphA (DoxX/SURF4 family)
MKTLFKAISFSGLVLMLLASVLVFNGVMPRPTYYVLAMIGTVAWFATVPFWMKRRLHHQED